MLRSHSRFPTLLSCLLLSGACLGGCSKGDGVRRGIVAGKVTFGGNSVSPATIRFEDSSGGAPTADIQPDGTYQVRTYKDVGLPVGTYKVAVTPGSMKPPETLPLAGEKTPQRQETSAIPEKFHSTATSGLQVEVREGENPSFDFDLAK